MSTSRYAAFGDRPEAPEKEGSDRSILFGIVGTVLFHILLAVLAPNFAFEDFSGVHTGIHLNTVNRGQTFDFELAQDTREQERDPFRFVETNPDAPENEPDKTINFSNRNQQSAQMEAAKELDPERRPSITNGQDEIKNDMSIVTGDMAEPQDGNAARPEREATAEADQQEQLVRMLQTPDAGVEKIQGDDPNGIASNISNSKAASTHADHEAAGAADSQNPDGGLVAVTAASKAQPKARPRLTAPRTTILTNRAAGVANIGITGIDARWSEYGEYLQELIEIIQASWYRILDESRVSPPRGSMVAVTFKINAQGETDIVKVEDEGAGKQGVFSCQNAIQARQPYRKWTEQMIAMMGEEQTLTFRFYHR
ncbi:hypothetical protein ESB00_09645 [Oleiharenicola lentus]|uniref:TonB C-terminal domain-containing protein n=1 Tax=Oleiharenicola lentus TaxID=2508720 RepID=A0A4Q1CAP1_9BACT|nr:hypothetical protein [Oleiharenicola lentus]RXK56114.1 hypothetical protein ESB00_09645 [Oleiharenicola lentus]